jgi:formyltetrahydrofolate synthetase
LIGMKLGDYVVTESGFGSDMGMEKFFDIVCRFGGLTPSASVLVTTVRAIKHHGGVGAADLANAVVAACEQPNRFAQLYPDEAPIREKIETVAKRVYGARDVFLYPEAEQKIAQFERVGLGHFPICMAKTHLSLSADPTLINAPEGFTVTVRDIRAYTGAGWLVPLCGDITQMPGLGKAPAALNVDIDDVGRTVGLF